jgi:TnpA family transposase
LSENTIRCGNTCSKSDLFNKALEGLLEQQTGLNPTEIMTDTAGSSDLIFGLFWLLGYQFSPRLADAGASVFWRVDKDADYGVLNDITRNAANARKIEQRWDDMMRMAVP